LTAETTVSYYCGDLGSIRWLVKELKDPSEAAKATFQTKVQRPAKTSTTLVATTQ
jgi:hypothetical protein